jgi:hypothetical protein
MAFFVASRGASRPIHAGGSVPKICPQAHKRAEVLARTDGSRITEHLCVKEVPEGARRDSEPSAARARNSAVSFRPIKNPPSSFPTPTPKP